MTTTIRTALFAATLALAACGGSGANHETPDMFHSTEWTDTPYLSTTATTHTYAAADDVLVSGVDYGARIVTDVGTLTIDLTETATPIAVNSFRKAVKSSTSNSARQSMAKTCSSSWSYIWISAMFAPCVVRK